MTEQIVDLAPGTTATPRDFGPLTRQMFVRYSGASGDLNPMHYDDTMARAAGNPSVFSQGMHQSALVATFATDWLGAEHLRRFQVRFREQVWPDDVLTCEGVIEKVVQQPDGGRLITVALTCRRQTGAVAISGSADFLIPETAAA
ncbi:MaoC/PaaZ C-terminal domain-containing protein [Nocardioides sp. BP30]|uniref:MaoC/PaaZ C-terminal domain-containing protein n=1 Tax=Nocardioides sp. BP30 TaxID=3036374 RepID=UPI002468A1B3|nr:MaoC/PaaZ C-terminal domain-containing protein [Nocardioides sp. BP30]WGL54105.1 MaoC/PaaZ C-terminal domain-containing protein [Nocardioides sp. BP30]